MTTGFPPYQLTARWIKFEETHQARMLAVTTDAGNEESIIEALKMINSEGYRRFYTWEEHRTLNRKQKLTLVVDQTKFRNTFYSQVFHGFTDAADEIVMWKDKQTLVAMTDNNNIITGWRYHDEEDAIMDGDEIEKRIYHNMNLTATTIPEFMMAEYKSGDGTALFEYVHDSINGSIEVVVKDNDQPETRRLKNIILADLCRNMSDKTIRASFMEPDDIVESMYQLPQWIPFDIQNDIVETDDAEFAAINRTAKKRKTQKIPRSLSTRNSQETQYRQCI